MARFVAPQLKLRAWKQARGAWRNWLNAVENKDEFDDIRALSPEGFRALVSEVRQCEAQIELAVLSRMVVQLCNLAGATFDDKTPADYLASEIEKGWDVVLRGGADHAPGEASRIAKMRKFLSADFESPSSSEDGQSI